MSELYDSKPAKTFGHLISGKDHYIVFNWVFDDYSEIKDVIMAAVLISN